MNTQNMKRKLFFFIFFALLLNGAPALTGSHSASAQNFALKTNLLYDATATVNAGMEFKLAPKWTMDISGNFNSWMTSSDSDPATIDPKWKHWMVQPEFRYYFCNPFSRHFFGFHAHTGNFNFGGMNIPLNIFGTDFGQLKEQRYQGWFVGGGISYGYVIALGVHWNLEFVLGVGYSYVDYDSFLCPDCGKQIGSGTHHYVGPTKAAISLAYLF